MILIYNIHFNNKLFVFDLILAQHLSLDRILDESEGSSEDEYIDSETLDTESELHGFEVFEVLL